MSKTSTTSTILAELNSNKNSVNTMFVYKFDSPIGKIIAVASDDFIYLLSFEEAKNLRKRLQIISENQSCKFVEKKSELLALLDVELKEYFAGRLRKFTVPIKTLGSEFQEEVWKNLQEIPYGATQTYGDLAKSMGRSISHSRPVGSACGANAHLLVIPCHRLVASGSQGGFNSGTDKKEWLISHEKKFAT